MSYQKRKIDWIVIHCTAGYGDIIGIRNYWIRKLKWKSPGYHIVVDLDGGVNFIESFDNITNGVSGYNSNSIHISYIGGVLRNDITKPYDSRTDAQKDGLKLAISIARNYAPNAFIKGHRDFPNVNKACPSFDAIKEYRDLNIKYKMK